MATFGNYRALELPHIAHENEICTTTWENYFAVSTKVEDRHTV